MRYVLFPGHVTSRTDGQVHYVNERQLAHLYALSPKDEVIWVRDGFVGYTKEKYVEHKDDKACRPRYDGNYPIFKGVR